MALDLLLTHLAKLYTLTGETVDEGAIEDAAIGFSGSTVAYLGPASDAPGADTVLDTGGGIGLPGLVDPHTHLVWAGSRSDEFAQRLAGAAYADILEAGGGILSTVRATRKASLDTLTRSARGRLSAMTTGGVTTVEIKSGYGLDPETERRMLDAAAGCKDLARIVPTFLGAHTVAEEHRDDRDAYVRQIIEQQLPLVADAAEFIDVYCDRGAFTLDEATAILVAGKEHGLKLKAHAEQVTHTGIAKVAAELGATSVEHLEHIDEEGISALAEHDTVAVLLPGAQLYLGDAPPPVAAMREAGVRFAVGTDLNPGSSPVHSLWTAATLACLLQGLTIDEAMFGITRNAGLALGRPKLGWLGEGSAADLAVFRPPPGEPAHVASLIQHLGRDHASVVVRDGVVQRVDGSVRNR